MQRTTYRPSANRVNASRGVNCTVPRNQGRIIFLLGLLLGVMTPFLIDIVMFGTPMPCKTTESFQDGSSLQLCEVKR